MGKFLRVLMMAAVLAFLGCAPVGSGEDDKTSVDGGVPTTSDPVESAKGTSPLYLNFGAAWESDTSGTYTSVKVCSIPADASVGTTINCDITMPEAQMFYSKVNFQIGSRNTGSCPIVQFRPYYYERSTVDFTPPGTTTAVTCSTTMSAACYGGAAPALLESEFPNSTGFYFLSAVTAESNFPLASENELRSNFGYRVNYLLTNDAVAPAVSEGSLPKLRTGTTWQDYTISCLDKWGATLFAINLTIRDENTADSITGPTDHFMDWD